MLTRTIGVLAVGLVGLLLVTSTSPAQPGKGGKGGKGDDAIKELKAELQQLRDQLKATEDKLAKAIDQSKGKGPEGFGGFGGKGWKGFDKKGDFFKKKDEPRKEIAKMNPAMIKEKYEFYKKLYDELSKEKGTEKKGFGGGGFGTPGGGGFGTPPGGSFGTPGRGGFGTPGGASSIEARLDHLMRELEELRKELKKK